jgi:hypothetical protein
MLEIAWLTSDRLASQNIGSVFFTFTGMHVFKLLSQLASNQTKEHVFMQMEFKCIIYIYNVIKMLKYVRRRGPVVWERHEALDTTTAAVTNDYNILHLI